MSVTIGELRPLIRQFRFQDAFIGLLGWAHTTRPPLMKEVRGVAYGVKPIAESGGFVVLEVTSPDGCIPSSAVRKSIHAAITPDIHEHLLIFVNHERTSAVFQFSRHAKDKHVIRERRYAPGMPVAPLLECLSELEIPFDYLDEEGNVPITLVKDIVERSGAFAERVTKRFYDEFKRRREGFAPFLDWIEDEGKRDWYISALLNRLMFIFFIQEKGFLPDGRDFLRARLAESKRTGKDRFYRDYLLPLFFFGFGKRQGERGRFEERFQGILFLDGGLFNVHTVEQEMGINHDTVASGTTPANAVIPDAEFERWFDYFYRWRWILEEEQEELEGHISPAILGYIFEKYVNQKQMGAYYTKEDITGYICRNTIIPRLFDMLAECGEKGKKAVEPLPIGPHPNLLNHGLGISYGEGIDRYVYPAVKSVEYLPTETDYEYAHRQKRYESILQDYDDGKITTVNDFITYNLDIVRMASDFVSCIQDADVLHDFYFKCLQRITVLDPTCGSGAFLFAALNILYPLYEACLVKMGELLEGEPGSAVAKGDAERKVEPDESVVRIQKGAATDEMMDRFREELRRLAEHPDRDYFLNKSIIVNNLFGVDILEEAVEICKLRLFLTLIAKVEPDRSLPNLGVEPLPDIDFNILAGNTLVGYASIPDIDRLWGIAEQEAMKSKDGSVTFQRTMPFEKDHSRLADLRREYGEILRTYRLQQLGEWKGAPVTKEQVKQAAEQVRPELDKDLWRLYRQAGLWPNPYAPKGSPDTFEHFLRTHQPFHWFLEFPSIAASGGFDVIVGNPPFVEHAAVRIQYRLNGIRTESCGNLAAFVVERCFGLVAGSSRLALVLPIASFATDRMSVLQRAVCSRPGTVWLSTYGIRPSKLFEGCDQRVTLAILGPGPQPPRIATTKYRRWLSEERPQLMELTAYCDITPIVERHGIVRISDPVALEILAKLPKTPLAALHVPSGHTVVYWHRIPGYFVKAIDFVPYFSSDRDGIKKSEDYKPFALRDPDSSHLVICSLNSSLFFWHWSAVGDGYHCGKQDVMSFPAQFDGRDPTLDTRLRNLSDTLMSDLKANARRRRRRQRTTLVDYDEFDVSRSKPILDAIDRVLAKHYGFTDEELDFIINYDIKYRMGAPAEDE